MPPKHSNVLPTFAIIILYYFLERTHKGWVHPRVHEESFHVSLHCLTLCLAQKTSGLGATCAITALPLSLPRSLHSVVLRQCPVLSPPRAGIPGAGGSARSEGAHTAACHRRANILGTLVLMSTAPQRAPPLSLNP